MINPNKIICALDFNDFSKAEEFILSIKYDIVFKVGMEFFFNFGFEGVKKIASLKSDVKIFLDLKLHDIPNTVSMALWPILKKIKPFMMTLHISGGKKMLEKSVVTINDISNKYDFNKPIVLGVTILTSLNDLDLLEMGHSKPAVEYVKKYAKIAKESGLDGIVCSPLEILALKKIFSNSLKIVTPGIRIKKNMSDDQARFLSPNEAFQRGSDFIVMGRPLTQADKPNEVLKDIIKN